MKTLFIQTQNIGNIVFAVRINNGLWTKKEVDTNPELFLKALDLFLVDCSTSIQEIDKVCVVTGPGSFTASRISVTIANAIAFAGKIPIFALSNPLKLSTEELLALFDLHEERFACEFAVPFYDQPPHITSSKK